MPKYKIENYTNPVSVAEQDVEVFLERYPDAILVEEEQIEEVVQDTTSADLLDPTTFQKDAAADADVVSQPMTASQAEYVEPEDTELAQVDTSLDSQDLANEDFTLEQFKLMTPKEKNALSYSEKQRLSREKNNEKNNVLDEIESEASKKFKSGALRVGSNLAQIPAFINRLKMTTLMGIAGPAFKEDIDKFKELDSATQDRIAQAIGSFSGGPIGDIGVAGSIGLEAAENLKNKAKKIEETLTKYDNTIGQDFIEGNVSQAVSRTFNEVIGTIPSIAQAFVPYVGISSIVAGSAADYSTEALAEGKKLDAANMIAATATGFSEGLLELTTKKIGKGLFKSLAGKSKDVVSKTLKEAALQTAKEAGQEGLSESTTEVLNRSIDALYKNKGDEWDNIWPELADVFIIGAAVGGGMSGTGNTGSIINKAVQVNSVNRTLQENNSQSVLDSFEKDPISKETINIAKNKYSGNILDIELKNKVSNGDISVEESKSIKQKFDVTRKNIQLTSDLKINENLIQETIGLLDERESLSSEIAKARGNKSLVQTQQSRLNDIDSRLSKISTENKLSITTETVENLAKDIKGLTVESLDNADAIVNFIEENNIDVDSKKASNEQGFIYQNPKTGEQTIVINKEIAAKDRAVNVAAHEFLHGLIFQTVKNSPETQIALGKSLNEYINKIDVNQIKDSNFAKRLESYKDMDEATQSEEVLTLFSDAIATGDIQFNESVFTKIGDVIRRTLQNLGVKVKFNNGKDVYNFVKDYNKSIEKGKLTKAQKAVGKKGAEGTLVLEKTVETEPGIKESKQLTPEQDTQLRSDVAEIKKEASEGEALAKKFGKDFIKGAKQTRLENKVLQEIKPIVDRVVTNRTKALYDPIAVDAKKNVSRQMFQESMRSDIESMVFDEFTDKQDIEKFIVNRAFLRANNLAERLGIKSVEEGITKGLEAAEKVAVEETTAPKSDKPKYRNILKSNTLPTETITAIRNKVLKTVRTLKSKLDTKVSKNKTVTPLIAEIKKNMGKQADIDFKKAMGGKKDGQIKRFLIKNKKVVLENMTTTWLMGAMPGAVQKQVNGSFTSDWQGKKIDREKTSTQQAGKTSGAEIVRRLPNAFKNLDDKTYLSYIIDESGAPIRGRKESLAKAMAEELSFDIFTAELQNENSDIRKALEGNQEALGVVLADNFVQKIARDVERGTVKFSKTAINLKINQKMAGALTSDTFRAMLAANIKISKIGGQPFYSTIIEYFDQNEFAIEEIKTKTILKKIAGELSSNYTSPIFGEIGIERIVNVEGLEKTIDYLLAASEESLTQGDSYSTIQLLLESEDINLDEKTLEGLNAGRAAAKKIVDKLVEKGFTGNEIKNIFTAIYSPSGLGGFKGKLNPDGKTRSIPKSSVLTEKDLGIKYEKVNKKTGRLDRQSYGSFMINVADFEQNFLKGIEMGPKVSTRTDAFTKNFYTDPSRPYNKKLNNQSRKKFLQDLQNDKEKYVKDLLTYIEAVRESGISPAAVRTFIRAPFASMDGLGKISSTPRWMPASLDGTLLSFKELTKIFGRTDGKVDKGVFEHTKPANRVALAAFKYALTGKKSDLDILKLELEDFDTAFITEKMDADLRRNKLQSLMGLNYVRGEGVMNTRYLEMIQEMNNAGITFYDAKTNELLSPVGVFGKELNQEMEVGLKPVKTEQKAINNGRSIKFSKSPKKIRVFDFDDTLARTNSNVLYTMPGEVAVYHGGSISSIKNITGSFVYFSQDQSQASEYAEGNRGEVKGFTLNESDIALEKDVFKVIRELGIQPKEKGWTVSDSRLYELIDDRFDQSFSKSDLSKLTKALANKGIKASRFTDSDLKSGKDTDNIVVFDKKSIKEQAKIDAATFAKDASMMQAEGAVFDFSEFSKIMDGKKGPLFEVAKKIAQARGTKDVFVLTARPQDAAGPIQEFLAELGLDIPLENITGLSDGDPKAKANWMVGKVAEGYNDFYFADDHLGNVKAVKDVFNTFDVKGKVQQAKVKFSKSLDKGFNNMIERQTGTESFKDFSKGVAQRRGKKVGKFKIFVSPSAEDFRGLTQYKFAGKGKQGEADQKFFEEALMDPYFKGVAAVEAARETIKNDTKALFKIFKPVKKKLNKLVPGIDFTYDGAIRVYLWNKAGIEIPGLTERDNKKLNDAVANDPELSAFADALLLVSKQDTWPAPTEYWEAKTTLSDLNTLTEKTNRKEYLTEFIENVDIIFSEKNLNKVEALYGKASRVAIENAIYAMKTGSNSPNQSGDGITNRWLQWVNNSIGTIMFFNRRSALLQLTSATNFLNWSDNNPAKAALAFANQPQYWKDWAMIFNSDKLKQRRSGLKSDVQEAEIANAAKNTEDKIGSIIAYLLKIGFSPTQIADSIAISSGGASFYRNRVNSLKKKGMSVAEAEAKAFEDMGKLSDEAQQSGDPALVSQQQRSVAGRLILSFQNTTMQYTRLMKKAGQDLINRRGDAKTHVSKILYYGALQNFIFNALSQTAFALIPGFDDDEDEDQVKRDEKLEDKASRVLNGMIDSIIRGTGIYGAVVTTIKNTYKTWEREADKGFVGDQAKTILEAANISPAIGSKLRKIYSAIQAYQFDKAVMEKHPWSVTIDGKFNPSATYSVIGNLASATLNIPLDRALAEARGVAEMFDNRNSEMQRIALALGWRTWNVGADNEEFDLIKMEAKQQRKEEGRIKAKETRAKNKKAKRKPTYIKK